MGTSFQKLKKLLFELFQLDRVELDFGVYRIINRKRDEITRFVEKELPSRVRDACRPDDPAALGDEVYSALYSFFRRYYREGSFIGSGLDREAGDLYYITFDHFIHQDLGGFLRRELDSYLKNELLDLDHIEHESGLQVEQRLRKIRVVRGIAHLLIAFLARIEDFRKQLWLKKKFVVETNYCVTLDLVPEALYPEIAANEAQREEWVRLLALNGPLTVEFLKANPYLMLDTRFFGAAFVDELLAGFADLDGSIDGVLVNSDNFQALNLLQTRYRGQIDCIYIDPPYNTGNGDFPYRDDYQRSDWLTMMDNRLPLAADLLTGPGSFICHIDEHEFVTLQGLIDRHFGAKQNIGPVIWDKRNPKGDVRGIAVQHEYLCWAVGSGDLLKEGGFRLKRKKENAQAILAKAEELVRKGGVTPEVRKLFKAWVKRQPFSGGERAYCELDEDGAVFRPVSMAWPNKKRPPDEYFEPLLHPVTNQPCLVPKRGWRNPPETMRDLLAKGLILFGPDETTQPTRKYLLRDNLLENVPSLLYFAGSDDKLQAHMGFAFENPKPVRVGMYFLSIAAHRPDAKVVDFFAGSGTTAHAVINLNRKDGGRRQYILVETGAYFDQVLKSRIQKVVYSKDWKDGRPLSRVGSSHVFKYLRLESYADTLNNLELRRTAAQTSLLAVSGSSRESCMLSYGLDTENRENLLNIKTFADPFNYRLLIGTGRAGETRPLTVDLIETFNYLLGLTVHRVNQFRGLRVIQGTSQEGKKVLVIWRKLTRSSNVDLERFFRRPEYNPGDREFDLIYVNGDHQLHNARRADETWKVRRIEDEFIRLMFDDSV